MKTTSLFFALASAFAASAQEIPTDYRNPLLAKVLLYTYTDGFRHDSIPTAIKQLQAWGPYYNISCDATEDQGKFTDANLAQYDAIMCVHTTGNLFSTAGQTAFANYLNMGGNFAAIHAASAGYLDKPWAPYTNALGATFDHHPARQNATFVKEDSNHPSTQSIPDRWTYEEEVYSFTTDPRGKNGAKLLISVDPSSYKENSVVAAQGTPHPIAWYQDYEAGGVASSNGAGNVGRSFYSSLGHLNSTWQNPIFMKHVLGGLFWTFGSNTTRVAAGLYGGAEPVVHTGANNNNTAGTVGNWHPVLGSNQTAPPPPAPLTTPTPSANGPDATGAASASSGALSNVSAPRSLIWAIVAALVGASTL
ncbi:hypothetical protein FS749_011931 [Ceratobasidium sp. UAMH 11750]|nr:hypothetical protein FS749_011931 [Ceratobasidium sp. UAMH 11750]